MGAGLRLGAVAAEDAAVAADESDSSDTTLEGSDEDVPLPLRSFTVGIGGKATEDDPLSA